MAEAELGRRSAQHAAGGDRRKRRGLSRGACRSGRVEEEKASWTAFLRHLKERGLKGMRLFVSDKCLGLLERLGESLVLAPKRSSNQ